MNRLRELFEDRQKLICFARDNRDMLIKVAAVAVLIVAAFFVFAHGKTDEKPAEPETDIVASAPEKEKVYVPVRSGSSPSSTLTLPSAAPLVVSSPMRM